MLVDLLSDGALPEIRTRLTDFLGEAIPADVRGVELFMRIQAALEHTSDQLESFFENLARGRADVRTPYGTPREAVETGTAGNPVVRTIRPLLDAGRDVERAMASCHSMIESLIELKRRRR